MESANTWLQLAAHARRIANGMPDSHSMTLMREIAARYEALAKYARRLGPHPSPQLPTPPYPQTEPTVIAPEH
jgi:hypothetical protein